MKLLSCDKGCGGVVYADSSVETVTCDPCQGIFPVRPLEGDALAAVTAAIDAGLEEVAKRLPPRTKKVKAEE